MKLHLEVLFVGQSAISKIIHQPLLQHTNTYEEWLKDIIPVAGAFDGHRSVSIIRPHGDNKSYTIILHFESIPKLNLWLDSQERKELIDKVKPLLKKEESVKVEAGFEFWFTPEESKKIAPAYKQFLVTSSAIYPLTLLVPMLLSYVFNYTGMPESQIFKGLLSVFMIVGLMVYIIMPRYTRLISKWLYR